MPVLSTVPSGRTSRPVAPPTRGSASSRSTSAPTYPDSITASALRLSRYGALVCAKAWFIAAA